VGRRCFFSCSGPSMSFSQQAANATAKQRERVDALIAAFNAHDVDAMLANVDDQIQWLNIEGSKLALEAEGKTELRQSMERYFRACPSCRSSLVWSQSAVSRLTALEQATWMGKNGPMSQSSLSVYEFRGDKILRVYYFPVEKLKD
jgi:hypothetical protein